jgi:hypothetical protein
MKKRREKDKKCWKAGCWCLTLKILTTWEAEIRRIKIQSQLEQIACETLSQKKKITQKGWWIGSKCRPRVQTPVLQKNV